MKLYMGRTAYRSAHLHNYVRVKAGEKVVRSVGEKNWWFREEWRGTAVH